VLADVRKAEFNQIARQDVFLTREEKRSARQPAPRPTASLLPRVHAQATQGDLQEQYSPLTDDVGVAGPASAPSNAFATAAHVPGLARGPAGKPASKTAAPASGACVRTSRSSRVGRRSTKISCWAMTHAPLRPGWRAVSHLRFCSASRSRRRRLCSRRQARAPSVWR
jgi:hypothetical protein